MLFRAVVMVVALVGGISLAGTLDDRILNKEYEKLRGIYFSEIGAKSLAEKIQSAPTTYVLDCLGQNKGKLFESRKLFGIVPQFKRTPAPIVRWGFGDEKPAPDPEKDLINFVVPRAEVSVRSGLLNSVVVIESRADEAIFTIGDSRVTIYVAAGGVHYFDFAFGGSRSRELCRTVVGKVEPILPPPFSPDTEQLGHYFFENTRFDGTKLSSEIEVSAITTVSKDPAKISSDENEVTLTEVGADTVRVTGRWMGVEVDALSSIDDGSKQAKFISLVSNAPMILTNATTTYQEKLEGEVGVMRRKVSHEIRIGTGIDRQRWITSLVYPLTLLAEQVRKQDSVVRVGDFIWFKDGKGKYHSAVLRELETDSASIVQKERNYEYLVMTSAIRPSEVIKPVETFQGFTVGQQVRWGRFSPANVRIDFMLTNDVVWVTRLSNGKQERIKISDIYPMPKKVAR